jgi:hypothetical protein
MDDGDIDVPGPIAAKSPDEPGVDLLVSAGLMTDVPPCSCRTGLHQNCVHHSPAWLRIRNNIARADQPAAHTPVAVPSHI